MRAIRSSWGALLSLLLMLVAPTVATAGSLRIQTDGAREAEHENDSPLPDLPARESESQSFRFSLIRIPVWVSDRKGRAITGLKKDDFLLEVDGRPMEIEHFYLAHERPVEFAYLVDASGSMGIGGKLEGSLQTLDYLLPRHRSDDIWRIIFFSSGQVHVALDQQHPERWPELRAKVRAYGKTALYDALALSGDFFPNQSGNTPALLLFTDGNDNHSRLSRAQMLNLLKVLDVPVFVVAIADGFVPHSGQGEGDLVLKSLEEMSKITGGKWFLALDKDQLPQIAEALALALRPQYMLGLTVERSADETRHRIGVTLRKNRGKKLRYRTGYLGLAPETNGGKK